MILRLRSQHRTTFAMLAIVLPVGLGLAFASRKSVPPSMNVPREGSLLQASRDPPVRDAIVTAGAASVRLRLWAADSKGSRLLELTPQRDLELPDVLVYWARSEEVRELPRESVLLGSLAGTQTRRFTLPDRASDGRLYLYSLAHQQLVASLEFER